MKITILLGAIRKGRKSKHVSELVADRMQQFEGYETKVLDLADYPLPLLEERIDEMEEVPAGFDHFTSALSDAQGVIIVAPEYKGGMPGALKNALDFLPPQVLHHIPVGIVTVSSGGFGGANCLNQLRLTTLALGGLPIPEKLCFSHVNDVFSRYNDNVLDQWVIKTDQFLKGFLWYAQQLSESRILISQE